MKQSDSSTPQQKAAASRQEKVNPEPVVQQQANHTGMPDQLKNGIENLSGYSLNDVKVHYNSSQPATLQAHAYAQGSDIHIAPGQEKHLPHEAWHVVQQKQGRVKPTAQLKGKTPLNDDAGLEKEADVMGAKALSHTDTPVQRFALGNEPVQPVVQRALVSKEDIFIEQVKVHAVKGLALMAGVGKAKENDTHEEFAEALKTNGLIDSGFDFYGKSLDAFLQAERDSGLKDITMLKLQDSNLLMEAVKLAAEKSSWDEYKTTLDDANKKKAGIAEGTGVKTTKGSDIKTRIKLMPVHASSNEGVQALALVLAADHPLGSTPSTNTKARSKELTTDVGKPYIAGHLLNDHLGGPGTDQRNITALPKDVNTEQSDKVEESVKRIVNADHKVAYYQVTVTYSQDNIKVKNKKNWYASKLSSVYGVYKEDADVSKLNFGDSPDALLKTKYSHVLPIKPPSHYATGGGYELMHGDNTKYQSGESRLPVTDKNDTSVNEEFVAVNQQEDVILKDDKQVKLDFISFAINSLQIRSLKQKIDKLEDGLKDKDKEITEKTEEIEKLKNELDENEKTIEKLKEELEDVRKEAEKEMQLREEQGEAQEDLEKQYAGLEQQYKEVKSELEQNDEKLQEMATELEKVMLKLKETEQELQDKDIELEDVKEESRSRIELLGYQVGRQEEDKDLFLSQHFETPPSPLSYSRFEQGVEKGKGDRKTVPDIKTEMLAGGSDGMSRGHKEGQTAGYMAGTYSWGSGKDPFVFIPFIPEKSESYKQAFKQAYEEAYRYAYREAYREGQKEYRKEYDSGHSDGYDLKASNNRNHSVAYNSGYEAGLRKAGGEDGWRHGLRGAERHPYSRSYGYLQSYDVSYSRALRVQTQDSDYYDRRRKIPDNKWK